MSFVVEIASNMCSNARGMIPRCVGGELRFMYREIHRRKRTDVYRNMSNVIPSIKSKAMNGKDQVEIMNCLTRFVF